MITNGITDKKLKWGYWYVTHKVLVRQIATYFLMFINLNLWLFAVFFVFKVYFFDHQNYVAAINKMSNSQVNYSTFNQANQPQQPRLSNISVLKTASNKYDLIINIVNPNNNWTGRVSGRFIIGEEEFEDKVFSLLGGEGKYVIQSGIEASTGISAPQFIINYIQWQRIRNQSAFNRFANERMDFSINDIKYQLPSELNLGNQVPVGGLNFTIRNNSLFDYWQVNAKLLFKRGGSIVAAHVIPLEEFRSGEERDINFRIFDNLVGISSVEVKPEVDIFDDSNIIEEPLVVGHLK